MASVYDEVVIPVTIGVPPTEISNLSAFAVIQLNVTDAGGLLVEKVPLTTFDEKDAIVGSAFTGAVTGDAVPPAASLPVICVVPAVNGPRNVRLPEPDAVDED